MSTQRPPPEQLQELLELSTQGKFQEALTKGQGLKEQFPESSLVLNMLGAIHFRLGQADKAIEIYAKSLELNPDSGQAHNNWGLALDHLGRREEALASYRKAVELDPGLSVGHNNLANALARAGRLEDAVSSYRKALEIEPNNAQTHNNVGVALTHLDRLEDAVVSFKNALRIDPELADAYVGLGDVEQRLGKLEDAVESFNEAIELAPGDAEAHNKLGSVLDSLGRSDEALACFDRAVAARPAFADAFNNRGIVLAFLGQRDEARDSYIRALEARPDHVEAHRNLSTVRRYQPDDPHIHKMRELIEQPGRSGPDRMHLAFGLGNAYDALGRYDDAFAFFAEGNRLRKQELNYRIEPTEEVFAALVSTFSNGVPVLDQADESEGDSGKRAIFVLGMPRSGTTLVEQILASHSQVHGAGELRFLEQSVRAIDWRREPISRQGLQSIRDAYHAHLDRIGASEPYLTDKLPFNFWSLGFILSAMPEARVVHVKRDARATCWSVFRQFFPNPSVGFAYDLADIASYYRMYAELMALWHSKFPGRIYDLDYEALTEAQEPESKKLIAGIGLEWEDACLEFQDTKRAVRTLSAIQVREKIYRGSSDEWRNYETHLPQLVDSLRDL